MPTDQRDGASAAAGGEAELPVESTVGSAGTVLIGCSNNQHGTTHYYRRTAARFLLLQWEIMKRLIILSLGTIVCLCGCNKSGTTAGAATRPDDAVSLKLKELAGRGATDCGRLDVKATDQQSKTASGCATQAAQSKHPFYVAYDMPGMSTGVAGSSDGKLFAVELQGSGTGAEVKSGPCPAELRVAHSGRVTCFIPGTMGLNPSASDPHSGIAVNPGMKPGGGMIPQPFPTPNSGTAQTAPKKQ